jgi:hypothetical protein
MTVVTTLRKQGSKSIVDRLTSMFYQLLLTLSAIRFTYTSIFHNFLPGKWRICKLRSCSPLSFPDGVIKKNRLLDDVLRVDILLKL